MDNCFTVLCWFLPYINMNQSQVYICPLPFEPPSHLPPISPLCVITEHWFALPESYSKFPLAICFTYGSVYVSMLLSPFVPRSLSLTLCLKVCSLCLRLHCCPADRFIHLIRTDSNAFLFYGSVIFHCVYVSQLLYPFICWWKYRLFPCPQFSSVQSLRRVWLFVTPWAAAPQASCPSPTPGACSNSCP